MNATRHIARSLAIPLAVVLTSCISNRPYRVSAPVLRETPPSYCPAGNAHYTLSFIEFDDMGELWDAGELQKTIQTIRDARSQAPLVVLFVHGWKNNASDKSGNVSGFRCELGSIAARYQRNVIGIYFGWRGDITNVQFFKNFTFWNRINAATRIPGAHMTDAIVSIMRETKENDRGGDATLILVGHSFGGLVLERAVTQALVERVDQAEATAASAATDVFRFPADLVVFLNEAGPALQAKQLLDILYRKGAEFSTEGGRGDPLLLSLTSKGDTATHLAFPGGQALSLYKTSLRKYLATGSDKPAPDEFGIADQRTYYLHTAANTEALQSHVIGLANDPAVKAALAEGKPVYATANSGGRKFLIVARANARNTTPYWIMQMPAEFVPDHTTIFRPEFESLLIAFLDRRPDMMLRSRVSVPPGPRLKWKTNQ